MWTLRVSAIVVDTSVWVSFFRGGNLPHLERALGDGDVVLSPIVAAELGSAPLGGAERRRLEDFLRELPLADTPFDHWLHVGHSGPSRPARG
jgi:predicted nucleic acid-binding protein